MVVMDSKKFPKVPLNFCCEICYYYTSRKSQYDRHLATDKHKKMENDSKMIVNGSGLVQKVPLYNCVCGKAYKYDSGYYRHKKKCMNNSTDKNEVVIDKEFVMNILKQNQDVMKQNAELQNQMKEQQNQILEVIKCGTIINNNSHNKTFNLQFFLNETCKDAMNIMDFVDSIKLTLSDLEKVGQIGYVEGISNIITTNLKALDVTQRPIHCTDTKREILYVKDENKWEKEAEKKDKIRKAIKCVANKNIRMLPKFKEIHPDCVKSESNYSDQYNTLMVESFGGSGNNDLEKENKIIKKISKEIIVDR
jgi:hypothetical protein